MAEAQARFEANCWGAWAQQKVNKATRAIDAALQMPQIMGAARASLKQQLKIQRKNQEALSTLRDAILQAASDEGDPWLTGPEVCPRNPLPTDEVVRRLRAEGAESIAAPGALGAWVPPPAPLVITVVVVTAVAALGTAIVFNLALPKIKEAALAFQGIGGTAQIAETCAKSLTECIRAAGTLPERAQEVALGQCNALADPNLCKQYARQQRKEGGATLTTTMITLGGFALAGYALYVWTSRK